MGAIFLETSDNNQGYEDVAVSRLIVFEILAVVLQLLSIVFNGAIICTLCRRSLLKYPSNRFVFSLCLSHLVVSILSITISLVSTFIPSSTKFPTLKESQNHDTVGNEGSLDDLPTQCYTNGVDLAHLIMMHMNFGVAVCTSITVALISTERYITIARPMRYKSIVTARRSLYAITCCWLLAVLITMMPLLLFENRDPVCGTFSVPMESLATYFGIVFAVVTLFALAVMVVCYTHIFRIAKAKCQKVQIGHFAASTVSSISSDWPSSAYSSVQGQNRFLHAGARIESSNSLLHWVLMTNLGRHVQPLRVPNALRGVPLTPPGTPTLPPKNAFFSESALNSRRESDETTTTGASGGDSRNGSTSSSASGGRGGGRNNVQQSNTNGTSSSNYFIDPSSRSQYQLAPCRKLRNRWKTYLQPNYNSPRKTIFTIVLLIGAVLFTQLPLSFVLFTSTVDATQKWFQFCTTVLFSTSSVANPVLYGFLNRSIRDQLWRLLRRKSRAGELGPSASSFRKRKRGQQQQLEEIAQNSKGFLSPASHCHLQNLCRSREDRGRKLEIPAIKISRRESISSDENSSVQSVASTNSVNIVGTIEESRRGKGSYNLGFGSKGKLTNQVQKRLTTSSPYYRTVLLKKANSMISKSNSLLPRLALPDVNVRRNSSGSIVSISDGEGNGVMSNMKGKVKEIGEEWSSSVDMYNRHDDRGDTDRENIGRDNQQMVEMQTFRNYSTPDLKLSPSASLSKEKSVETEPIEATGINMEEENVCINQNVANADGSDLADEVTAEVGMTEGQLQEENVQPEDSQRESQDLGESEATVKFSPSAVSPSTIQSDNEKGDSQPGSSHELHGTETAVNAEAEKSSTVKMEGSLSADSRPVNEGDLLPENFPRKPSQDSGADMSFSDEEDEPPQPQQQSLPDPLHQHLHQHHSPILLPTASLSSLSGGTMTAIILNGNDVNAKNTSGDSTDNCNDNDPQPQSAATSTSSLFGQLFFIGSGNVAPTNSGIIFLPCSCPTSSPTLSQEGASDEVKEINENDVCRQQCGQHERDNQASKNENGVTVTITDSNSDTHLFNPKLFNSNRSLLYVDNSLLYRHSLGKDGKPHKSKSESDICRGCGKDDEDDSSNLELKIRSNCHINHLDNSSLSHCNKQLAKNAKSAPFTVVSCCKKCCKNENDVNSPSRCLVLLRGEQPIKNSCSLEILQENVNKTTSITSPWLSVMSVQSSCSSLSSTCPLRILDGQTNSKSDISEYDDFEDHIEI